MEITDPNDATIPIDIILFINEIVHDQLISHRDTVHVTEAQADSARTHSIVLIAHAHQVVFALEIDIHAGIINISA